MDGDSLVEVPDTACPLNDHNLQVLMEQIDLTSDDGYYGISTFIDTLSKVTNLLYNQR